MKNIGSRLAAEEKAKLIKCFHRLQENQVSNTLALCSFSSLMTLFLQLINKYVFRMEVLGAQVPDVISERLFCIFASQVSV